MRSNSWAVFVVLQTVVSRYYDKYLDVTPSASISIPLNCRALIGTAESYVTMFIVEMILS